MKQLFWKEWYELRLLPLASAVCVGVLIFGANAFNRAYDPHHRLTPEDTILPLLATWMIFALLAGAGVIAQEIGSGGLDFLSSLPASRRRIWWVKVATSGGMLLLAVVASGLAWTVIDLVLFRADFFRLSLGPMLPGLGKVLLILAGVFAVALGVSPFLDRPISALVAALLIALAYFGTIQSLMYQYVDYFGRLYNWQTDAPHTRDPEGLLMLLTTLSIPLFAAVSYWTFTRGESLRSARRFRVGALTGAAGLAVAGAIFLTGFTLHFW